MPDSDPRLKNLRIAFIAHFAADILFALPLMFAPIPFLTLLGWQSVDPVAARLTAAALFGIGIESWLGRNSSPAQFAGLLNLKIIWSAAAILGFILSLIEGVHGRPPFLYAALLIFLLFNLVWIRFRLRLSTSG